MNESFHVAHMNESCHSCGYGPTPNVTHASVTHASVTHASVTHASVTHASVTHANVTHANRSGQHME